MAQYEVTVTDCEEILDSNGDQLSEEEVRTIGGRYWSKTYLVEASNGDEAIRKTCHLIESEPWSFTWEDTTFLPKRIDGSEEPELVALIDLSAYDDLYGG